MSTESVYERQTAVKLKQNITGLATKAVSGGKRWHKSLALPALSLSDSIVYRQSAERVVHIRTLRTALLAPKSKCEWVTLKELNGCHSLIDVRTKFISLLFSHKINQILLVDAGFVRPVGFGSVYWSCCSASNSFNSVHTMVLLVPTGIYVDIRPPYFLQFTRLTNV